MPKLEIRGIQSELMEKGPQATLDAEPGVLCCWCTHSSSLTPGAPVPSIFQASCWLLKKGCVKVAKHDDRGFVDAFTSWSLPMASDSKGDSPAGAGASRGLCYILTAPLCPALQAQAAWRNELGQDLWWAIVYHVRSWNQTIQVRRQKRSETDQWTWVRLIFCFTFISSFMWKSSWTIPCKPLRFNFAATLNPHKVQNALEETEQPFWGSSLPSILFTNLTSAKAQETNFPPAHKHCLLAISLSTAGV